MPYYLAIGMSASQFWEDDPWLAAVYREANDLKRQRTSEEMWLQGLYNFHAISTALFNVIRKKGVKAKEYLHEPIRVIPLTEQEKKEREEAERKKVIDYLNR